MRCSLSSLAIVTSISMTGTGFAQPNDPPAAPPIVDATPLAVDAKITAVTLYPGRAAVTRTASLDLQPGVYDLRFADLPLSAHTDSLQARTGGALKVLSVDFLQEAVADPAATPEVIELDKEIRSFEQAIRAMADQRSLIKSQEAFLDALTIRSTGDASTAAGTGKLDLEEVKSQMQFITAERKRLNSERASLDLEQPKLEARLAAAKTNRNAVAGAAGVTRSAVVSVVASSPFNGEVALTYLVSSATWQPAYNVRATAELNSVQIEYDAILTQRTGEDWNDVRLTLSTAQPTVAANPPTIQPWFVDIARPEQDFDSGLAQRQAAAPMEIDGARRRLELEHSSGENLLEELAADAQIGGAGSPSVTFELPRAVTVKTSSDRQQRTRIAAIDSKARFVHVATPLFTEAVYLRGDLTNSSAYQLLAGPAAIFVGQDYVGPTAIASVAPQGEFQMHFGIDQSVKARKQLLAKSTESTGLLSGGRRTSSTYRLTVDNSSGRDITLELWDRMPVSRNEEIQIQLIDLTTKLATDAHYVAEQQPQGLLKWWLTIPASARGLQSFTIDYTVRIDRAKDVIMTPLPE